MIFSFRADGTPNGIVPERIFQGSKKANDIYFICPTSATNVITATFTFPNGEISDNYVLECISSTELAGITDELGNGVNVFKFAVPTAVTALCGIMTVQFFITNGNGERLATATSEFTVEEGNADFEPQATDSYEEILSAISVLYGNISTLSGNLDGKLDKSSALKKIYATNENGTNVLMQYDSSSVGGTIMLRDSLGRAAVSAPLSSSDIANKEYVDGKISTVNSSISSLNGDLSDTEDDLTALAGRVGTVESAVKGANKSVAFSSYSEFIADILTRDKNYYNVGQNVYIISTEVPDLWISQVMENSTAYSYTSDADITSALKLQGYFIAGYYKISALETQRVDLSSYLLKTNISVTENQDGSVTLNILNA